MNLDRFRFVAERIRNVATPIRTITVTVRERTWPRRIREPNTVPHDVDTVLPIRYRVRQLSSREISGSGGLYEDGAVKLGPVTPPFTQGSGGGFTREQLMPNGSSHTEIFYILSGDYEGEFKIANLDTTDPLSWYVVLNRSRVTP
jgi:hypothetical protein